MDLFTSIFSILLLGTFSSGQIRISLNSNELKGTWTVWNQNKSEKELCDMKENDCGSDLINWLIFQVLISLPKYREEFTPICNLLEYSTIIYFIDSTTFITAKSQRRIGPTKLVLMSPQMCSTNGQ